MANEQPQSRPEAPKPAPSGGPSVYGDQWGSSGKQNEGAETGQQDRPEKIDRSREENGAGES